MKSQTSFYNRSLIISNLKRHGYFGILFFVLSAVISNVGVLSNMVGVYDQAEVLNSYETGLLYVNAWDIFMVFLVAVILGVVLFRYIQEERALAAIHAMPVSRKSLFVSQCISFELIFGIPVVVNGLIAFLILVVKGYPVAYIVGLILMGILQQLIAGTAVFGLVVLAGMMVGSSVLQVVLAGVLMGAPFVIVELTRVLIDWTLLGYPHGLNEDALHVLITPFAVIPMVLSNVFENEAVFIRGSLIIVVMMVASIGLSYWLYQKRDLERHHDLIVFNWAKKAFIVLLTLLITLSLSGLIGSLMGEPTMGRYIGLIIGSILGYTITKMIAEKTVNVFSYYKEGILVVFAFLLAMVVVDLDLIGYESRVPDSESVEVVYYSTSGWMSMDDIIEESTTLVNDHYGTVVFNELASIDAVKALHESLIDDRHSEYVINRDTVVIYKLKNGRLLHRHYNEDIDPTYLEAIYELPEYKRDTMEHIAGVIHSSENVEMTIRTPNGSSRSMTESEYKEVIAAYAIDFNKSSFFEGFTSDQWGSIDVRVYGDQQIRPNQEWYKTENTYSFPIGPSYENTFGWMEENKMENLRFSPDDVTYATISDRYQQISPYEVSKEDQVIYPVYDEKAIAIETKSIDDRALIEGLYDQGYDYSRIYERGYTVTYYLQGGGSYSYRIVDLPLGYESYVMPEWY